MGLAELRMCDGRRVLTVLKNASNVARITRSSATLFPLDALAAVRHIQTKKKYRVDVSPHVIRRRIHGFLAHHTIQQRCGAGVSRVPDVEGVDQPDVDQPDVDQPDVDQPDVDQVGVLCLL